MAVQVSNLGPEGAPADTPIALYTLDKDGTRTLHSTWELGALLWPGQAAEGVDIALPVLDALGGVVVVVNDDGTGTPGDTPDCDDTNSEAVWTPECP